MLLYIMQYTFIYCIAVNFRQGKILPNSNLMYYGNNLPDIFSPPEPMRIHTRTEYDYYNNNFN